MSQDRQVIENRLMICLVAAPDADVSCLTTIHNRLHDKALWLSPQKALDLGPYSNIQAKNLLENIQEWIGKEPIDCFLVSAANRRKHLLATDMDSTVIEIECIDELADMVGRKAEIASITERTMAGELEFNSSLVERVKCLAGTHIKDVEAVCRDRVSYTPGAACLVATMRNHNARTILLSGGFTLFTNYVAKALGFHANFANALIVRDGRLTGEVEHPVFGPVDKREIMIGEARSLNLDEHDTIAVGDGANDIDMIIQSGIGVAFKAKAKLKGLSDISIDHTDLKSVLYAQGYHDDEMTECINP